MQQNINLKELEMKAYTSYHEDGLLDLFLGLGIIGFVETVFFNMTSTASIIPALAIVFYMVAKKKITIPRIGHVKFSLNRNPHLLLIQGLLVATLLLGLLFGLLVWKFSGSGEMPPWMKMMLEQYPHLIVGFVGVLLFCLTAYATGIKRLYFYAALTLVLFVGGWMLGIQAKRIALLFGVAMMIAGFALLIRFIRKYPKAKEETSHDKERG
jgi:hypothetical protein